MASFNTDTSAAGNRVHDVSCDCHVMSLPDTLGSASLSSSGGNTSGTPPTRVLTICKLEGESIGYT